MKIILKHKYCNTTKEFENKKEMIDFINNYYGIFDYFDNELNKMNHSKNKNIYSVYDLAKLFSDYELMKGK